MVHAKGFYSASLRREATRRNIACPHAKISEYLGARTTSMELSQTDDVITRAMLCDVITRAMLCDVLAQTILFRQNGWCEVSILSKKLNIDCTCTDFNNSPKKVLDH